MVFKIFFIITAIFNLNIDQINIKTACLYSFINQINYIKIFKSTKIKTNYNIVYKLPKVL